MSIKKGDNLGDRFDSSELPRLGWFTVAFELVVEDEDEFCFSQLEHHSGIPQRDLESAIKLAQEHSTDESKGLVLNHRAIVVHVCQKAEEVVAA